MSLCLLLFPPHSLSPTPMWPPSNGVQSFTKCSKTLWSTNTRSFPWTAVLQELLQCGFFPKASSPAGTDCSCGCSTVLPKAAPAWTSLHRLQLLPGACSVGSVQAAASLRAYPPALAWDSPWAVCGAISASVPGNTSSSSSFSDLDVRRVVSHFSHSSHSCFTVFLTLG